jgi:hypothetical protein
MDEHERCSRELVEAVEAQVRAIGRWLTARGDAALWEELFAFLATEAGGSVGPDDPLAGPLPSDAAARFLREDPGGDGDR